jgi:hypothetical protein
MKSLKITFTQTRMVKGAKTTSEFFAVAREIKSSRGAKALVHAAANAFEQMRSKMDKYPNAKHVWSKSIPFTIKVVVDDEVVVDSETLQTSSGSTFRVSLKNADKVRENLLYALEMSSGMEYTERKTSAFEFSQN